jgi:hypothetical protein
VGARKIAIESHAGVQARHEGLTIATANAAFKDYEVPLLDARA